MTAVRVRAAGPEDVPGIRAVAREAWYAAHEPIVGSEAVESFLEDYYDPESLESQIESDAAIHDVADDPEEGVIGFVLASPTDDDPAVFSLGRIYVSPERWGEGVGRRLLSSTEDKVRDRGGTEIRLGVMAENERAVSFYEAAGFERIDDFYDDRLETPGYRYAKEV